MLMAPSPEMAPETTRAAGLVTESGVPRRRLPLKLRLPENVTVPVRVDAGWMAAYPLEVPKAVMLREKVLLEVRERMAVDVLGDCPRITGAEEAPRTEETGTLRLPQITVVGPV